MAGAGFGFGFAGALGAATGDWAKVVDEKTGASRRKKKSVCFIFLLVIEALSIVDYFATLEKIEMQLNGFTRSV